MLHNLDRALEHNKVGLIENEVDVIALCALANLTVLDLGGRLYTGLIGLWSVLGSNICSLL